MVGLSDGGEGGGIKKGEVGGGRRVRSGGRTEGNKGWV